MDSIVWFGRFIDGAVLGYISGRIAILCAAIGPFIAGVLTIWGVKHFRAIGAGEVPNAAATFAWEATVKVFIVAVATTAGVIQYIIVDPSESLAGPFVAFFAPPNSPLKGNPDVWAVMTQLNKEAGDLITAVAQEATGLEYLVGIIATALLTIATAILQILCMAIVVMCKVYRFFVLIVSPLFIMALLDKSTSNLFHSWRGVLLNMVVVNWVGYYVLGLALYSANHFVDAAIGGLTASNLVTMALDYLILMVMLALVLMGAPYIAASLTGGSPLAMGSQLLTQTAMTYLLHRTAGGAGGSGMPPLQGGNTMAGTSAVPYAAGHAAGAAAGWAYQQVARMARNRP